MHPAGRLAGVACTGEEADGHLVHLVRAKREEGAAGYRRLSRSVFAWYQFSREGSSEGLRRAYVRWPLTARLERRRQQTARGLRGASWNNDDADNLLSSYRNNNTADNRNNNIGFRCVLAG